MSKTNDVNAKSQTGESQGFSAAEPAVSAAAPKPHVERWTLSTGAVRLYGVSAAARWLGVELQALSALAHGRNCFPISWEARARAEFPGLFAPVPEQQQTISGH